MAAQSGLAETPYYVWTDENGIVNFSQTIPRNQDATVVADEKPFGPKPEPYPILEQTETIDTLMSKRSRELNCIIGKKALAKLSSFKNIFARDADGWWRAISDEQRQNKIVDNQNIIEKYCEKPGFFD